VGIKGLPEKREWGKTFYRDKDGISARKPRHHFRHFRWGATRYRGGKAYKEECHNYRQLSIDPSNLGKKFFGGKRTYQEKIIQVETKNRRFEFKNTEEKMENWVQEGVVGQAVGQAGEEKGASDDYYTNLLSRSTLNPLEKNFFGKKKRGAGRRCS